MAKFYPDSTVLVDDWEVEERGMPRSPKLWPTYAAYKEYLRELNGGVPFNMWWAEMGVLLHLAEALHVDYDVLETLLENPSRLGTLELVCHHPAGGMWMLRSVEQYEEAEAEVEAHGGPEGWDNWRYPPLTAEQRQKIKEERARKRGKPIRYWLYHIYGEDDRLLYIGVTRNQEGRERDHRKKWGSVIERFEWQEFSDHDELMAEEKRLIALHNPPFNAQHVGADA